MHIIMLPRNFSLGGNDFDGYFFLLKGGVFHVVPLKFRSKLAYFLSIYVILLVNFIEVGFFIVCVQTQLLLLKISFCVRR